MFETLPTPVKTALDKRSYRCGILSNKLKVVLVRDAESDHAGASLTVAVGHLNDPEDLLGLSHFVEHLVYLGTKKYPDEGVYEEYLKSHGGFNNATTRSSSTEYYFSLCIPKSSRTTPTESPLPQALDYLAQFFISPLFTESALDRELKAVHNEFEGGLQCDGSRMYEVQRKMINPKHPASRFSDGNNKSLRDIPKAKGIDVREACIAHHEKYYSANLMTLAVVSPHTLDEMQDWVVEFFSSIENKDAPHPAREYDSVPLYDGSQCGKKLSIATVMNRRLLKLEWAVPENRSLYASKPWSIVSGLIGHEGQGGLYSSLKKDGKISSLYAGYAGSFLGSEQDQEEFEVSIELTEAGLEQVEEVVSAVFSFIRLCGKGLPKWYYDERSAMSNLSFKYNCESGNPLGVARGLSGCLQRTYIPIEDILRAGYMMTHFDENAAMKILDRLTPENVTITLAGQSLKDSMSDTEPWYETKYGIQEISSETMSSFRVHDTVPYEFSMPKRNPYVPENFKLIGETVPEGEQDLSNPKKIEGSLSYEVFHKTDKQFERPYISVEMQFKSPVSSSSPKNSLLSCLFEDLVADSFEEMSYVAGEAGLYYAIHATYLGLDLDFWGYSDKLMQFIETVLRKIVSFKADEERFKVKYDQLRRGYENYHKLSSSDIAGSRASTLLSIPAWSNEQCQACISDGVLTPEAVDEFGRALLRELLPKIFVYGNADEEWAVSLSNIVKEVLNFDLLDGSEVPHSRLVQIPTSFEVLFRQKCPNSDEKNSATRLIYQIGPANGGDVEMKRWVVLVLLARILSDPFFKELRTNQQLGYSVGVWNSIRNGIACFEIEVTGTEKSPEIVCRAVEEYLKDFRETRLDNLSDDELESHVVSFISSVSEPDLTFYDREGRLWGEIVTGHLMFDRDPELARVARTVSAVEIREFFDEYIAVKAPQRRRFLSIVYGNVHDVPKDSDVVRLISSSCGGRDVRLLKENTMHEFRAAMQLWRIGGHADPFVSVKES